MSSEYDSFFWVSFSVFLVVVMIGGGLIWWDPAKRRREKEEQSVHQSRSRENQ